jgi:hypothetical protein
MTVLGFEHGAAMFRVLACGFNYQVHPVHGAKCEDDPKIVHHHGNL